MRVLHALFAGLFSFAAYVNINDPHPLPWIATYAAAAVTCVIAAARLAFTRMAAAVVGGIALVWALTYLPAVLRHGQFLAMFDEWTMKNQEVVENREMFGLLIVAAWMGVTAATSGRRKRV